MGVGRVRIWILVYTVPPDVHLIASYTPYWVILHWTNMLSTSVDKELRTYNCPC